MGRKFSAVDVLVDQALLEFSSFINRLRNSPGKLDAEEEYQTAARELFSRIFAYCGSQEMGYASNIKQNANSTSQ